MDRNWAPLAPTKRHSLLGSNIAFADVGPSSHSTVKSQQSRQNPSLDPFAIGKLPSAVIQRILDHVPVTDLPKCALAAMQLARFVADERLWERRIKALSWQLVEGLTIDYNPRLIAAAASVLGTSVPPPQQRKPSLPNDDDFGDFEGAEVSAGDDSFGGFVSSSGANAASSRTFSTAPVFSYKTESSLPLPSSEKDSAYQTFKRIAIALKPFVKSFANEASPTSSLLFSHPSLSSLKSQATLLANIARFTSPGVLGFLPSSQRDTAGQTSTSPEDEIATRRERQEAFHGFLSSIREAADYLEGVLLSAFEGADARRSDAVKAGQRGMDVQKSVKRSEEAMHEHAFHIWQLARSIELGSGERQDFVDHLQDMTWSSLGSAGSAAALSFLEKRNILFRKSSHDPEQNIVMEGSRPSLDFTAMDKFMNEVLEVVKEDGSLISRVFPGEQGVLLAFASRVANEVMADYFNAVLRKARSLSVHLYLQSSAATFAQAFRLVDLLLDVEPKSPHTSRERCESIVFSMWEVNMDEYLHEERDWVKESMSQTCEESSESVVPSTNMDAAFLNSHNPAAVKRTVLSSFKDVLLMPVTVVPRTAGIVGGAVIRTAGTGLSQLNPLRWQSSSASNKAAASTSASSSISRSATPSNSDKGYMDFSSGGENFQLEDGPDDDEAGDGNDMAGLSLEDNEWSADMGAWNGESQTAPVKKEARQDTVNPFSNGQSIVQSVPHATKGPANEGQANKTSSFSRMQLLLSLDTALQLIQVNRESLKRMETFTKYPGLFGARVKEEMEEVSVSFFQCLSEKHVSPGFSKASEQIKSWKPSEHDQDTNSHVAPLVHFFELVHVGDTIQQMVQVYYDQELGKHIDRTDFLNGVVREKKRFESTLDENVAAGLNVGVDLLMGQAEHLITVHQDPRDYYPEPGADLDLANPTKACKECIECLQVHCHMLVGSTDKTVLEVFYQEVSIRLHAIICKHLKRQIISLDGGFKVIADLNAYQAFISSLRQTNVTLYFDALKMLGNLYIIDNPKELAAIVRDANMFNGTLSPEDLYEFLQARCDFKSIEKAIDKEIYGFKATEDCSIM